MIDKSKTYRTRDGREVRIYAIGGQGDQAVHGAILDGEEWRIFAWYGDGKYTYCDSKCRHDLIEVRPRIKRTVWLNVYPCFVSSPYNIKENADSQAGLDRLACVRVEIDCAEGDGL